MWKTIGLGLNAFDPIPPTLQQPSDPRKSLADIDVDLAQLYHHYYLDAWGTAPPDPDPSRFEHVQFLMPTPDFRFKASGLGMDPTGAGNKSNELGQAFCRLFLHDHLDMI